MSGVRIRRLTAAAAASAMLLGLVGCGGDATLPAEVEGQVAEVTTTAAPPAPECSDAENARLDNTRTYAPLDPMPAPGDMPDGSTMAGDRRARPARRGRLGRHVAVRVAQPADGRRSRASTSTC
jgi:hypothetical protein